MRTTLDIDEAVLSAARAKARADGTSVGRALSDIAREALHHSPAVSADFGFPVLHGVPGHEVTDEMVADALDDE